MSKTKNTIEINGKLYDATTGVLLDSSHTDTEQTPHTQEPVHMTPESSKPGIARSPAKRSISHAPARSRTLMRQAVKKPASSLKRHHKAHVHTDTAALQSLSKVIVKPSALSLDEQRLRHAKQIPRSQLISRFPAITSDSFT